MKTLVLGGARSGKSRYGESLAMASGLERHYLATATAGDEEMAQRIAHHQQNRDEHWLLREATTALAPTLLDLCRPNRVVLVDCLTLWLSNCLEQQCWEQQRDALLDCLPTLPGHIVLISNEVGSGVIPMGPLSREFVDHSGRLHQELAAICDQVSLIVAGLPLHLKGNNDQ